ncbi:hypothetical protein UT300005_08090 [Clostridium sp. CTA-5]
MLECIRRESAKIIFASNFGVLIFDKLSKIHMMYAEDYETANLIVNKIPDNVKILVVHQKDSLELVYKKFNFTNKMICNNTVYIKKEKLKIFNPNIKIKSLSEKYKDIITKNYSKINLIKETYIYERLKSNTMFGAFIDNKLCGFIGTHEEGSIGMLQVLPEYRGIGIASVLQSVATNKALDDNRYIYGQVIDGNIASKNLQKKLGFIFSKDKIYWLFR